MIRCPRCQAVIPPDDIHLGSQLAKCRCCLEVFRFEVQRANDPAVRLPVMPEGVTTEEESGTRRIVHSWFTSKTWAALIFTAVWNFMVGGFVVAMADQLLNKPGGGFAGGPPWALFLLVPGLHVVCGLVLAYHCLASLMNETVVEVGPEFLRVAHGPIPWVGNKALPAGDVRQLYVKADWQANGNRTPEDQRRYRVLAALTDGRSIDLVGGLVGKDAAEFYVRTVEDWLDIAPAPASGAAA
jgi:hypothetical protein